MGNTLVLHRERPILVVEDEQPLRLMIQAVLEDEGLATAGAANGQEALNLATASQPRLVVLDMGLPVVNGDGVAEGLRTLYGDNVPIVVITADGRAGEKAARVRAFDFLEKPFDIDQLLAVIYRIVDQAS